MMQPCFVLSLPRCRTAWLTAYLNGAGVRAFHDGWKFTRDAAQLRTYMDLYTTDGPVVNVDSTNIIFLKELQDEFPLAKYVKIIRSIEDIDRSMKRSYGEYDYKKILRYAEDLRTAEAGVTVDYGKWTMADTMKIFKYVTDGALPPALWHMQAHDFKIEITEHRIHDDIWYGQTGRLDHIVKKLRD